MYKTKETAIRNLQKGKNFGTKPFDLFRNDRDVVLEAIKTNPYFILDADAEFRNERNIMLYVSKEVAELFQFSSDNLKEDKSYCLEIVSRYGSLLEYVSPNLRSDVDVVKSAVKANGEALTYASDSLKDNREIVLLAVQDFGFALKYASERLKNDKELVLAAITLKLEIPGVEAQTRRLQKLCLIHASPEIQEICKDKDPVFALEAAIRQEKFQEQLKPKPQIQTPRLKM